MDIDWTYKDFIDEYLSEVDAQAEKALTAVGMLAEKYAKENAPVDTGRLRNSITFAIAGQAPNIQSYKADRPRSGKQSDVEGGTYEGTMGSSKETGVYIGTNVEYASAVEFGTTLQRPHPYLKPAVSEHGDEYRRLFDEIMKEEI